MKKVHVALQAKGGVGKSFVCFLLAQYMIAKGGHTLCIDTDCVNRTFHSFKGLGVVGLDVLDGKDVDLSKFDELVELILESDDEVVVDGGASVFLPFRQYMIENKLAETFVDAGRELVVHTVVSGGPAMEETLTGFTRLVEDFPPETTFVVWLNPFWGPVERDEADFEELREYKELRHRVTAIVRMPEFSGLFQRDLADMLQMRLTFEETLKSGQFWLLNLQRLVMIKRELFGLMDSVRVLSPAAANSKVRRAMDQDQTAINRQQIIDSIARRYQIFLKPDDPIMAALAVNEAIVERYEESTKRALLQFGSRIEGVSDNLISESKKTASRVLEVAAKDGEEHILEVANKAGIQIKKILDEGITEGKGLYKAVRWERWICLTATVLSMAFAVLVFLMTRR